MSSSRAHRLVARTLAFAFLSCAVTLARGASAHDARPAYLQIEETATGRFHVLWRTPVLSGMRLPVALRLPDAARNVTEPVVQELSDSLVERRLIEADPGALAGTRIGFPGLEATITDVLVRLELLDGTRPTTLVRPSRPWVEIAASRGLLAVAGAYLVHGVEHILFGFDHLLFVLALLLIVKSRRVLLLTITAFTLAHSITLALATLGLVRVAGPPIEATIALSILLLASEILRMRRGEPSATARRPWIVAFSFGLLHGFGFAGALTAIGLPQGDIPLALFAFNVGVELGHRLHRRGSRGDCGRRPGAAARGPRAPRGSAHRLRDRHPGRLLVLRAHRRLRLGPLVSLLPERPECWRMFVGVVRDPREPRPYHDGWLERTIRQGPGRRSPETPPAGRVGAPRRALGLQSRERPRGHEPEEARGERRPTRQGCGEVALIAQGSSSSARGPGGRLRAELREYAIAVLYLYVCLGTLLLFKTALLREEGVNSLHFGLALGKALILGKFMLLGEAARLGARARAQTLLHLIVRRVLSFLALLIVLSVAEEFVVGWLHGHPAAQTLADYEARSALELFATCLLMLLVLVPYVATREIGRTLGPGGLRRILLQRP